MVLLLFVSRKIKNKVSRRHKNLNKIISQLNSYMRYGEQRLEQELTEVLPANPQTALELVRKLQTAAQSRPAWPFTMEWLDADLGKAEKIFELQLEGSRLPSEEVLSGVYEDGSLRVMHEEELMEQKLELISALPVVRYTDLDFVQESVYPAAGSHGQSET